MTTTPEPRPANWAPPDPKICRGDDCTATLVASDPDLCEKCDLHGSVGDVRSLLVQASVLLRSFPGTACVASWACHYPLAEQPIPKLAASLLTDVKAVQDAVNSYAASAEADRIKLVEHERVAAGLRRAAEFYFGDRP